MNKIKLAVFSIKNKNNNIDKHIHQILQNHPTFHSEERSVNLVRRREHIDGLQYLLISLWFVWTEKESDRREGKGRSCCLGEVCRTLAI